jgi:hypothetical protein
MQKQSVRVRMSASLRRIDRGTGLLALLMFAPAAPGAWINMGSIARGQVSLLIDTVPAGGPLTVTFNVADATVLTPTVGTPDMQFQLAVRRPLGGPNITARVDGTPSTPSLAGPESIPFTEITWTFIQIPAGPRPGGVQPFSGTNVAIGTNPLTTLTTTGGGARYTGGELRFSFTPSRIYLQGSYTGTVVFTATRT